MTGKSILLGHTVPDGKPVHLDIDRLVESRMLLQASSGYGKSHAIRRILEQSHGSVQHLVLDWEGEFYTLREKYAYALVGIQGGECRQADPRYAGMLARTFLETGTSAIIDLSERPIHDRHRFARLFLEGLLDAPKEMRHACLVIVDEAHSFCPEKSSAESGPWVGSLMAQGRKRGLAGILATQRLAKLDKDAAAEAHCKLVGKATLDDDVRRSADELGWGKAQHADIRFLKKGHFYAYGPAFSHEGVLLVHVGDTETRSPRFGAKVAPVPPTPEKVRSILGARLADLPQEVDKEAKTAADLRVENQRLKRELAAKPAAPAPAPVKVQRVEVPVLKDGHLKRVESAISTLVSADATVRAAAEPLLSALQTLRSASIAARANPSPPPPSAPMKRGPAPVPAHVLRASWRPAAPPISEGDAPAIGKAERAVLAVLATHGPCDRRRLTLLAGYRWTGTFSNALSALRTAGYLSGPNTGVMQVTPEGAAVIAGQETQLPTGRAFLDYWLQHPSLGLAERKALQALLDAGREGLDRDGLCARTEYQWTGTFSNALSSLRTAGLLVGRNTETMRASDELLLAAEASA